MLTDSVEFDGLVSAPLFEQRKRAASVFGSQALHPQCTSREEMTRGAPLSEGPIFCMSHLVWGESEYLYAILGDEYRVLELRGEGAIDGRHRPSVVRCADLGSTEVDHRFDGQCHSRTKAQPTPTSPYVGNMGLGVHGPADPVPSELANHAAPLLPGDLANRMRDVAEACTGAHFGNPRVPASPSDADEVRRLGGDGTYADHARRVAHESAVLAGDIDVEDVPVDDRFVTRGDPVTDDVVSAGAHRGGKAMIPQLGRPRPAPLGVGAHERVDVGGRDARPGVGFNPGADRIQRLGCHATRPPQGVALRSKEKLDCHSCFPPLSPSNEAPGTLEHQYPFGIEGLADSLLDLRAMSVAQLEYFVAVAEEQHLTRAAARLHISQPPLTRQIKSLEEELGAPLFERSPRGMTLLPAGEIFLNEARAILLRLSALPQLIRGPGTACRDDEDRSATSRGKPQIDQAAPPS